MKTVFVFDVFKIVFNEAEIIFHLIQEDILLSLLDIFCLWFLFPQCTYFELKFFNLVALQVDELEHLEVLLLVSAENP